MDASKSRQELGASPRIVGILQKGYPISPTHTGFHDHRSAPLYIIRLKITAYNNHVYSVHVTSSVHSHHFNHASTMWNVTEQKGRGRWVGPLG